jgi:2-polyprenyl-3-methyl-5-hydroxy-6-metoxy-1,4-benzoquinol methylase
MTASNLDYWCAQAEHYDTEYGRGLVGWTARWQHEAVLGLLAPRGGETILDAGCGSGLFSARLAALGARVTAVDICPQMLALVPPGRAETICSDLETLDLRRSFDAVACVGALNFMNAHRAMQRLAAHTREGGQLVVMVTRPSLLGAAYHVSRLLKRVPFTLWSARQLTEMARRCGLEPIARRNALPHDVVLSFQKTLTSREVT